MRIAIYGSKGRGAHVARACLEGFRRHDIEAEIFPSFRGVWGDTAIAYGWTHQRVFEAYPHFVFWDLGYWGRRSRRGIDDEYHRYAVDNWDTASVLRYDMPSDRFDALGIEVKPWVTEARSTVLLAGMSAKSAGTHGYEPGEWEGRQLQSIRARGYDVVYREKPNKHARIDATIQEALATARMLVTHHSNAAIDALVEGLPIHTVKGVARCMSSDDIGAPFRPSDDERLRLFSGVAHCQWTMGEVRRGEWWDHAGSFLRQ